MPAAAKKTTVRKDPPKARPVNSGSPYYDLVGQDPNKKYVWVYKAAKEMGPDFYRDVLGYEPTLYVKGGARPKVGPAERKDGEYIESMGHILMECSKERAQEIEEHGFDGQSGQAAADVVEKHMFNSQKAISDLTRRIAMRSQEGSEYFELQAERGSVAIADTGAD